MPGARKARRMTPGESTEAVSNLINRGVGNAIGSIIEKVKLKGKPGYGTFNAGPPPKGTGARKTAEDRLAQRNNKAVMDSAAGQSSFEDLISGKKRSY